MVSSMPTTLMLLLVSSARRLVVGPQLNWPLPFGSMLAQDSSSRDHLTPACAASAPSRLASAVAALQPGQIEVHAEQRDRVEVAARPAGSALAPAGASTPPVSGGGG